MQRLGLVGPVGCLRDCIVSSSFLGQGAAFCKHPTSKSLTPRDEHHFERVAPLEGTILETNDRGGHLNNLELLTTLPG